MSYVVFKRIKGHVYAYEQSSWREGNRVRTRCRCLGRADGVGGAYRDRGQAEYATAPAAHVPTDRAVAEARAALDRMERDFPDDFRRLREAYEPVHRYANGALRRYLAYADDGRAATWALSARLFCYYNAHGPAERAGIRAFGSRRDWRDECAADVASLRGPGGREAVERAAKAGLRAAKAHLTRTLKRRTWGRYRRRTLRHAQARLELQALRFARIRVAAAVETGRRSVPG